MTREEEIKKFALERNSDGDFDSNDGYQGLIEGAQWADEHEKNPWRDAKKELPELIEGWSGSMLVLENGIWPRIAQYCDNKYHKGWVGHNIDEYSDITNWMPIPECRKKNHETPSRR